MAREAETNPRIIPDARIAARMVISISPGSDTTRKADRTPSYQDYSLWDRATFAHAGLKAIASSAASAMLMRAPARQSDIPSCRGTRNSTRPDSAAGAST